MGTKYATYEVGSPPGGRESAELVAKAAIDKMVAREQNVSSRSGMSYSYEDGFHRFCVAVETEAVPC